jgi:hypothetical protein
MCHPPAIRRLTEPSGCNTLDSEVLVSFIDALFSPFSAFFYFSVTLQANYAPCRSVKLAMLYTKLIIPMFARARSMPIVRIRNPLMVLVMNIKTCSIRVRIGDF